MPLARAQHLAQGDLPLGAVGDLVGDAGRPAAVAVVVPGLGQEQVGIDQGLVAATGDAQVDGDDAVVDLAQLAAVLPLHAGGLGALLARAGLIDDADGAQLVVGQGVRVGRRGVAGWCGPAVVPGVVVQELLEGADGGAGGQGDGLDRLARQVGEQAAAVDVSRSKVWV